MCIFFFKAAEHSMWVAWKSIRESTPWSQAVKPHTDIMGALTMVGHESGSTKQLKSCGNINIKSRAERTDGCLLRQKKKREKKSADIGRSWKCWRTFKKKKMKKWKEGNSGSCVGPVPGSHSHTWRTGFLTKTQNDVLTSRKCITFVRPHRWHFSAALNISHTCYWRAAS